MSIRSAILATATLCAYVADAHMIMAKPVPFSVDKVDNGPITEAQWPCKFNLGYTVSTMNEMKAGEEQSISFKGSAVHGGGSCQLSVTTDTEPTPNSKFKVIESIEGGCPGVDGPLDFKFTLPDSVPNGKATFAWTWFAKLSGGPEMYMNCAPITVSGGASDTSKFDALPDMFVANLPNVRECKTATSKATKFPNPGQTVISGNDGSDVEPPAGSDCGEASGDSPSPSGGAGGAPASSAAGGQASAAPSSAGSNDGMYTPPAGAGATSAAATSAAATSAAAAPTGAASAPAVSKPAATSAAATGGAGGVFAPGASSAAGGASTKTTLVTVTGTPSAPAVSAPAATTPAAGTGASGAAPTTAPAAGGSGSTTCSENGAIVCNGTTQFGICNNGSVVWQAVAAGTTCNNGTISKRAYNGRVVRRNRRSLVGHVHKH
ncbi:hypothetical protein SLS61_000447 [Didymella pomorum]